MLCPSTDNLPHHPVSSLTPPCPLAKSTHLLCFQHYPSFLLWTQGNAEVVLLIYICQWDSDKDRRTVCGDGPFMCIIISYLRILTTVLKIPSTAGKYKAFSTCGSHLTMVSLFYGSIGYVYLQPLNSYTAKDRIATVIYTMLTSMLNPFIYNLRNKDLKQGLGKLIDRIKSQWHGFYAKS